MIQNNKIPYYLEMVYTVAKINNCTVPTRIYSNLLHWYISLKKLFLPVLADTYSHHQGILLDGHTPVQ